MNRVEPFGFSLGELNLSHSANLKPRRLDTVDNRSRQAPFHGVRLDDGERAFRHSADYNSRVVATQEASPMTSRQLNDPEIHKGAIEGDRPDDEQIGNPH